MNQREKNTILSAIRKEPVEDVKRLVDQFGLGYLLGKISEDVGKIQNYPISDNKIDKKHMREHFMNIISLSIYGVYVCQDKENQ